ncbi:hypothetical protein BJV82DRAFT_605589 [Fennellomyces sp. T-0311]|nr:hypothetical protein BJV82DRAFT_605589 [Fennellomyces sp. T-0311]
MGKKEAISNYALQRLKNGKWNDLSTDPDTPARPPQSLWNRITEVLASLWRANVKMFLVKGLLTNAENLAQVKMLDPTDPDSLSEEFCLKAIEDGATAIVKNYVRSTRANKPSNPPTPSFEPSCSFVSSARRVLGEEKFVARLIASREYALDRVKESYMEKKKSELPSGPAEFIDGCNKHDPPFTNQQYYYRRNVFVRKQIPDIAEVEGVRPQYMLQLLKLVKGERVKTSKKN